MNTQLIKSLTVLFLGIFLCSSLSAQDIIHRIDGKTIECKIINLGEEQVSYEPYGLENPPVIDLDMSLVDKITFETGYEYEKNEISEVEIYRYEETHRNALKLNLLSPIGGTTHLTYERLFSHRTSGEFGILIHGAGINNNRDVSGIGFEAGYKFLGGGFSNLFSEGDSRNALGSAYLKPEILIGVLNYDLPVGQNVERLTEPYGAIFINGGFQIAVGGKFLIDIYLGVGPGFYGEKHKDYTYFGSDEPPSVTGHTLPVGGGNWINDSNFSLKSGLKIGFAFGDKLNAREINKKR